MGGSGVGIDVDGLGGRVLLDHEQGNRVAARCGDESMLAGGGVGIDEIGAHRLTAGLCHSKNADVRGADNLIGQIDVGTVEETVDLVEFEGTRGVTRGQHAHRLRGTYGVRAEMRLTR